MYHNFYKLARTLYQNIIAPKTCITLLLHLPTTLKVMAALPLHEPSAVQVCVPVSPELTAPRVTFELDADRKGQFVQFDDHW